MSYRLELTDDDWHTIDFVGHRYHWSEALQVELARSEVDEEVHDTCRVYDIPEHIAWTLNDAFDADTEGGHSMFPMLADCPLRERLIEFWQGVV